MNITEPTFHMFQDSSYETEALFFTPDGKRFCAIKRGHNAYRRSVKTRDLCKHPIIQIPRKRRTTHLSPCGTFLITVEEGRKIAIFDLRQKQPTPKTFTIGGAGWVTTPTLIGRPSLFAYTDRNGSGILDIKDEVRAVSRFNRFTVGVRLAQFSQDRRRLFVFTDRLYELDVTTGKTIRRSKAFSGFIEQRRHVAMCRKGKYLAAANSIGNIQLLETATMERKQFARKLGIVGKILFSPCGNYILVSHASSASETDARIKIYCRETGRIAREITSLSRIARQMTISPNSHHMLMNAMKAKNPDRIPSVKEQADHYSLIDFRGKEFGLVTPTPLERMFAC